MRSDGTRRWRSVRWVVARVHLASPTEEHLHTIYMYVAAYSLLRCDRTTRRVRQVTAQQVVAMSQLVHILELYIHTYTYTTCRVRQVTVQQVVVMSQLAHLFWSSTFYIHTYHTCTSMMYNNFRFVAADATFAGTLVCMHTHVIMK